MQIDDSSLLYDKFTVVYKIQQRIVCDYVYDDDDADDDGGDDDINMKRCAQ